MIDGMVNHYSRAVLIGRPGGSRVSTLIRVSVIVMEPTADHTLIMKNLSLLDEPFFVSLETHAEY